MKKVLITFGLMLFLTNFANSNETKCADFKKFSKEYLKCNANKIKKATINKTNEIKDGTVEKTYNIRGTFPTNLGAIELSYDSENAIEEFEVELQVQYWESDKTT